MPIRRLRLIAIVLLVCAAVPLPAPAAPPVTVTILYKSVKPQQDRGALVSDVLEEYVRLKRTLEAPQGGRMTAAQ